MLHAEATFELDPPNTDEIARRPRHVLSLGLPYLIGPQQYGVCERKRAEAGANDLADLSVVPVEEAEGRLLDFEERWDDQYAVIGNTGRRHCESADIGSAITTFSYANARVERQRSSASHGLLPS